MSKHKIKLFSDGADLASLLEMAKDPRIAGLTTNPSLMRKAGVKDYRKFCQEVLSHVRDKPISFEVCADSPDEILRQALEIGSWGENVYVKIPITNSEGKPLLELIHKLSHQGIKLNVTAILTVEQVYLTTQSLCKGAAAIVSVFAGRIADAGCDPMPIMKASLEICRSFSQMGKEPIELLWASTREVFNLIQAEMCGVHIITIPPDIIKKISGLGKSLNQVSRETVQTFKEDALAAGFKF